MTRLPPRRHYTPAARRATRVLLESPRYFAAFSELTSCHTAPKTPVSHGQRRCASRAVRSFAGRLAARLSSWSRGSLLSEHVGGSDPKNFLGGSSAKKWGRSRPICSILRGDFRRDSACKSLTINSMRRAQGEESAEGEAEVRNSCLLHLTHLLPSRVSPRRNRLRLFGIAAPPTT